MLEYLGFSTLSSVATVEDGQSWKSIGERMSCDPHQNRGTLYTLQLSTVSLLALRNVAFACDSLHDLCVVWAVSMEGNAPDSLEGSARPTAVL